MTAIDGDVAAGAGTVSDPTLSAGTKVMAGVSAGAGTVPDVSIVTSASSIVSPPPTLFVRFPAATFLFDTPRAFAVGGSAGTLGLSGAVTVRDLSGFAYVA